MKLNMLIYFHIHYTLLDQNPYAKDLSSLRVIRQYDISLGKPIHGTTNLSARKIVTQMLMILLEHMSKYNNVFLTGEFAFLPASLKCNNVLRRFLTVKSIAIKIQLFQIIQLSQLLRYRPYTVNEGNNIGRNDIS